MLFIQSALLLIIGFAFPVPKCAAFSLRPVNNHPIQSGNRIISSEGTATGSSSKKELGGASPPRGKLLLFMSSPSSKQFDVSRQVFDPLSLRSVRGDAIVRYDAANQSQPLRILLYALFSAISLSAPSLSEAIGYEPMGAPATIASVGLAAASGALFFRECARRSSRLTRIEKELNTESLPIRLPTASNPFAESPFSKPVPLKGLRAATTGMIPPRIIAICGSRSKLSEALSSLAVYRERLKAASVFVVAASTDGSSPKDWQVLNGDLYKAWLADSYQPQAWLDHFKGLKNNDESGDNDFEFRWFGLTSNGRSFGSGDGAIKIVQLMGQFLRPIDFLDASDDADATKQSNIDAAETELLEAVESFYKALTTGNQNAIDAIFSESTSKEVSEVIGLGGRIDSWKECLAEGARPSEMQVSGADVTVFSDTEAYTTCIEFPANTGMDSASLLAVQRFTRANKNEPWRLDLHQTIPWSLETRAQGTLQCDCRGCVALTRGKDRRPFGGIIG